MRTASAAVLALSTLIPLRAARAAQPPPSLPAPAAAAPAAAAPAAAATITSPFEPVELAHPGTAPAASAPPAGATVAARPVTTSSLRVNVQADTRVVDAPAKEAPATSIDDAVLLHGVRFGYGVVMNYDRPAEAFGGQSLKDKVGLRSPHHFLLGYELVYRVTGHSWLNVILLGNGMIAGLEQSKILPSANLMVGFEIKNSFQVGVGANLSPLKGSEGHTVIAAGWTPRIGTIYTPVHAYFIPDVDGVHRLGLTTGVTF